MTNKGAVERLRDSFTPYDEGYIPDEDDEALNIIENAINKLDEIKKYVNRLYKKYKAAEKANIENCEKCQQAQFNLGAFSILEDLRKIIHDK